MHLWVRVPTGGEEIKIGETEVGEIVARIETRIPDLLAVLARVPVRRHDAQEETTGTIEDTDVVLVLGRGLPLHARIGVNALDHLHLLPKGDHGRESERGGGLLTGTRKGGEWTRRLLLALARTKTCITYLWVRHTG